MKFVIVTGMSGAGKTTVLKFLEDMGYFCVDNLPPAMLIKFAELCFERGADIDKVALGIDIRGGKLFSDLFSVLEQLFAIAVHPKILSLAGLQNMCSYQSVRALPSSAKKHSIMIIKA